MTATQPLRVLGSGAGRTELCKLDVVPLQWAQRGTAYVPETGWYNYISVAVWGSSVVPARLIIWRPLVRIQSPPRTYGRWGQRPVTAEACSTSGKASEEPDPWLGGHPLGAPRLKPGPEGSRQGPGPVTKEPRTATGTPEHRIHCPHLHSSWREEP